MCISEIAGGGGGIIAAASAKLVARMPSSSGVPAAS